MVLPNTWRPRDPLPQLLWMSCVYLLAGLAFRPSSLCCGGKCKLVKQKRKRKRKRYTYTHRDTQRHTETHTHTETHRDTQRHTHTHRDTQRHTETHRDTQRHTETHTHTQTHTDRHTQTDTHTHTQALCHPRVAPKQTSHSAADVHRCFRFFLVPAFSVPAISDFCLASVRSFAPSTQGHFGTTANLYLRLSLSLLVFLNSHSHYRPAHSCERLFWLSASLIFWTFGEHQPLQIQTIFLAERSGIATSENTQCLLLFFQHRLAIFLTFCGGVIANSLFCAILTVGYHRHWLFWTRAFVRTPLYLAFCGGAAIIPILNSATQFDQWLPWTTTIFTFCGGVIFSIHCYNQAFCSGAITFTPICAFCGGAIIHWQFLAFCSGAWLFATTLNLSACSSGINRIHCYNLAFCSGATWTPTPFQTFCGGVPFFQRCIHCYQTYTNWSRAVNWIRRHTLPLFKNRLYQVQWAVVCWLHWTLGKATRSVVFCGGTLWQHRTFYNQAQKQFRFLICAFTTTIGSLYLLFGLFAGLQFLDIGHNLSAGHTHKGGIPGPNSGHSRVRRLLFPILLLGMWSAPSIWNNWSEGEGRTLAMEGPEAPDQWIQELSQHLGAKPHGTQPLAGLGHSTWTPEVSCVKKRSLKRAFRRSLRDGCAWYRGRCWTPADFPRHLQLQRPESHNDKAKARDTQVYNQQQQDGRRLKLLTWNCAGLSRSKLDDIRLWLTTMCIDGVILTETRWKFSSEWEDSQWSYVHSSSDEAGAQGILFMLSKRVCPPTGIRWQPVLAGRLVHFQIRFPQRNMDIIACYQFAYNTDSTRSRERQRWWDLLDKTLHALPTRNVLVLTGDFNCSVLESAGHSGPSTFCWRSRQVSGTTHPDQGRFMSIIRAHGLNVLNSWQSNLGPTYVKHDTCSRIDFVIVRKTYADGRTKDIKYLWDAPFLPPTPHDHVPILSQIPKMWIPPGRPGPTSGVSFHQRNLGRTAFLANTAQWQAFLAESEQCITQFFQNHPEIYDFQDLHQVTSTCFQRHFSAETSQRSETWTQQTEIVKDKWQHRRACQAITPTACFSISLSAVFRAWHHLSRFQVLIKHHRKHAALVRRARFQEIISEAQYAASRHDSHKLFQLINRFAPKQPKKRVQIRNCQGQIATPVEELAIVSQFVRDAWSGPDLPVMHPEIAPGTPFGPTEVLRALLRIPIGKSVASHCAPGVMWKAHAHLVAPWLWFRLAQWWNSPTPHIPPSWKHGWLIFLSKPNKAPTCPEALRPICLQCPIGKAILGMISQIGQNDTYPEMSRWPLWGYICCRSTQDALLRVSQHCRTACALVASERSTPQRRASSLIRPKICGAAQLFIDLKRAFDSIDRSRLFSRLGSLGVSEQMVKLLTEWHRGTQYIVHVAGTTQPIPVARGVRQGCKAAPWLWNCVTLLLLHDLSGHVDATWLCEHLNLYADDGQAGDTFTSEGELQLLLRRFGWILHFFQEYGLTINESKSMVLLTMGGSNGRKRRSSLTSCKNGTEWIKIEGPSQSYTIPVAKSAKYLGAVVSYQPNMAELTARHRISVANIAFTRLSKWLTGKKGLKFQDRFRLWNTCIFSVLTYGVFPVGLNFKCIQMLQTTISVMLRRVFHSHAFYTGLSNHAVFLKYGVPLPAELLWAAADTLHQSVTKRCLHLAPTDIVHTLDWSHLHSLKTQLKTHPCPGTVSPQLDQLLPPTDPGLYCTECGFVASDVPALRRHFSIVHAQRGIPSKPSKISCAFTPGHATLQTL